MGRVASRAALDLHCLMLIDEWASLFGMALEADCVLLGGCAQLAGEETSVRIMAVSTVHQGFVHAMVEGPVELLFGFEVTAVAKLRRLLFHQELRFFGMMGRVAVDAAHIVLHVRRAREIAVLLAEVMTCQAALADFFGRGVLESKDLAFVPSAFDVRSAGTVAGLAAMPVGPMLLVEHGHVMRRVLVSLVEALAGHIFVAGLTGFGTHVVRGIRLFCSWLRRGAGRDSIRWFRRLSLRN